ncbi:MAG: double-strand break repair helicase AddA [Rhodospirillales bacterium]
MTIDSNPVNLATQSQHIVANPKISAWVDASAGSGKTKVLTDRVLRLMLAGQAPERILCLTFTKAASAEMTNRVTSRLAHWATAKNNNIIEELRALGETNASATMIARARTLFARVIDAPGGLKVQTVHSFCQSALERFPAEAGVPPGFQTLDERTASNLLREARNRTLRSIMEEKQDAILSRALDYLVIRGEADALDNLLQAFLSERARIIELGGWNEAAEACLALLGFNSLAHAEANSLLGSLPDKLEKDLYRLVEAYGVGGKTDGARGAEIATWLAMPKEERNAAVNILLSAFFTGAGEETARAQVASKHVLSVHPWFTKVHEQARDFLLAARERMRLAERAIETVAALEVSGAVAARYNSMKLARAALDFDDLITFTRDLLIKDGGAQWAALKLDQGIDHILVDEAQDTNPEQWQVIQALANEFFQEDGRSERTLFAVGDPKQSIFSFQRADPRAFGEVRNHFEDMAKASGQKFQPMPLPVSFRSVSAILRVVDATFSGNGDSGITLDGAPLRHFAARGALPGQVELWPPMKSLEADPNDPWTPLVSYPQAVASPITRLATAVASEIKRLIDDPTALLPRRPGDGISINNSGVQPSDIMIVLQQRRPFGDAITKALKDLGVPTSGLDRMRLADQLVVQDLLNLARVALLPEDDLALACVLKSPLIGFTEEELFHLANRRGRLSLWQRLKTKASKKGTKASEAWELIAAALNRADSSPPFDFFQWALGPMQGRPRLIAAMGQAVSDPIQEFLSLALRYSQEMGPSLTGFVAWIEQDATEIKRELEGSSNGVRIMTAHAAKGLQAPIVFLPDAIRPPAQDRVRLYWKKQHNQTIPVLGATSAKRNPSLIQPLTNEAVIHQAEERRRLLYVAMTRAEDRLYVMGWNNRKTDLPGSWHQLVKTAMISLSKVEERPIFYSDEPILVYREGEEANLDSKTSEARDEKNISTPLQPWALTPYKDVNYGAITAPSSHIVGNADDGLGGISPLRRSEKGAKNLFRFGRGLLIHKLLERLPTLNNSQREKTGMMFLRRSGILDDEEGRALLQGVLSIIDEPTFGPVFHQDALAETPIAGVINGRRFAGVIDRLIVTKDTVRIVDFKTNRPPPNTPQATQTEYLKQMAIYRGLARQAFPDKKILSAILWTEAPRLDLLEDRLLDAFTPESVIAD